MAIYSAATHPTVYMNGTAFEKIWAKDKVIIDLFRAGLINAVVQQTTPASTSVVWLNPQTAGAGEGTVQIHNGTAWVTSTPALLMRHLSEGGATLNGAIAMNGNKITGLAAATANGDAVRYDEYNATAILATAAMPKAGGTFTGAVTLFADGATAFQPVTKQQLDAVVSAVSGALLFRGAWDASAGTFPGAGAADIGWFYRVSVGGTVNGVPFTAGDSIYAYAASASTTTFAGNWMKVQGGMTFAQVVAALAYTPLNKAGDTMSGVLAMGANKITGVANGSAATDAAAFGQIPVVATVAPLINGTAAVGISAKFATEDHVHPNDTTRLALAGGTMTGAIAMGTSKITGLGNGSAAQDAAAFGQIPLASSTTPTANGTAAVGTGTTWARADHVHASDTAKANLVSPTFTGTPTLPTGTIGVTQIAGNNTTALATTAFVAAAVTVLQGSAI
jgi:hypothetical protein